MDCQTWSTIQEPSEVVSLESDGADRNYPSWILFRWPGPCGEDGGLPCGIYISQIYC